MNRSVLNVASGAISQQLASAAIFLLLVRGLDASGYGLFSSSLALVNSFYSLAGLWASPYIVTEGSKSFSKTHKLGTIFLWGALASIVLPLVLLVLLFNITPAIAPNFDRALFYLVALLLGTIALALLRVAAQIRQDFRAYARLLWGDRALLFSFLAVLITTGTLTPESALVAASLSQLLVAVAGFYWVLPKYDPKLKDFNAKSFAIASSPVFLAAGATYASSSALVILIANYLYGIVAAGKIAAAFVLFGFLSQPVSWLTPILLPRFVNASVKAGSSLSRNHMSEIVLPVCAAYSLITVAFTWVAPNLLLVVGTSFKGIEMLAVPVIGALVAELVHMLVVPLMFARSLQKEVLLAATFRSGTFFGVAVLLPRVAEALVVAILVAGWVGVAVELWFLRKDLTSKFVRRISTFAVLSSVASIAYAFGQPTIALMCSALILPLVVFSLGSEGRVLFSIVRAATRR